MAAEPYEPFLSGLGKDVCGEKDTLGRSDVKTVEGLRGEVPYVCGLRGCPSVWVSNWVSLLRLVGDTVARVVPRSLGLLETKAGTLLLLGLSGLPPLPLPLAKARTLCGEVLRGGGSDGRLKFACVR